MCDCTDICEFTCDKRDDCKSKTMKDYLNNEGDKDEVLLYPDSSDSEGVRRDGTETD